MFYITYKNQGRTEKTATYPNRAEAEKAATFLKSQGAASVRIVAKR